MKKLITLSLVLSTLIGQAQIFTEDFNSGIPATFTLTDVDGTPPAANVAVFTGSFTAQNVGGEDCAGSTSWLNPAGQADDWMATPLITIPNTSAPVSLSFDAIAPDGNFPDGVEVYVSTNGATPADFSGSALYNTTVGGESSVWTTRVVDLSNYLGQDIYIAFRNNSNDQFICDNDLKRFNNKLTMNLAKTQQDLKFVEYPEVGQTHLILMNGTVYSYLQYQSLKQRTAFVSSAMTMDEWTPKVLFCPLDIQISVNYVKKQDNATEFVHPLEGKMDI